MIRPKKHLENFYRSDPERFDRTQYVRLDKNEDLCGVPEDLIAAALGKIRSDDLSAYPQTYQLYEKLSKYLGIPEDSLLITTGSDAAIKNVFEVFISPGDGVIIPDPTYAMYEVYAGLFEANLKKIPYTKDLALSISDMISAIDNTTRLVALANPNSPTGTIVPHDEIVGLIRHCASRDVIVLIDEAYFPFYSETVIDLIRTFPNLIVTRTFSKAFGLAALRLGYSAAHPDLLRHLHAFRPIYETHGLAVSLGCEVLKHPEYVAKNVRETVEGRQYLIDEMRRLGFFVFPSFSNFVNIVVGESIRDPLVAHLKNKKILIKAGASHPALTPCVRITAGPKRIMEPVVFEIEAFMKARPLPDS